MRYRTYLKERGIWAAVFGWLLFSIETFLLTMRGSLWLGIYVAVSLILAYVAGTYADYRHLKKYMEKLYHTTEELDKKYLLPEMMEPGARQEEKLLHQIVYMTNKSMNEQVARYKRSAKEYKEYIELWIHEVKVPIAAARMVLTNHPTETAVELETELCAIEGYTDQALYYARSSEVEKDYFIRQVHLQELVEETLLQKKRGLLRARAGIVLEELDKFVYSDGKWLTFILGQIVENSIKYAGESPLKLHIWAREEKERVLLFVEDNGIGIPAEEVKNVCEKGFTGSNGRKYKKATGIGLYLCDKLCSRLGHSLLVESEEGEGCKITFVFPKSDFMTMQKR